MKTERRNIVNFFELLEPWQEEARSNLGGEAESQLYIEPLETHSPEKHYLLDFSDCMRTSGRFDGYWTISNNSAIGLKMITDDECELTYL